MWSLNEEKGVVKAKKKVNHGEVRQRPKET